MDVGKTAEREISLIDLFWKIVMGWRRLVILGIIFSLLVPTLMYVKDRRTWQTELQLRAEKEKKKEEEEREKEEKERKKENERQAKEIEKEKAREEMKDFLARLTQNTLLRELEIEWEELDKEPIYYAMQVYDFLEETRNYMATSVLMAMDPYHVPTRTIQFYIHSDYTYDYTEKNELDYTSSVGEAYGRYVTSGKLANAILSKLGLDLDAFYVGEMLSYERSGNFLYIKIICDDVERLDEMAKVVRKELAAQTSWISNQIGSHTLKLISDNTIIRIDSSIISHQTNYQNTLVNYKNQFESMRAAMSEEQQIWLDYTLGLDTWLERAVARKERLDENEEIEEIPEEVQEELPEEGQEEEPIIAPSLHIQYVLLGLVLGIFLACAWSLCEILFAVKLQNAKDLPELYGVRLLGEISVSVQKKKLFYKIDDKILQIKNQNRKKLTAEQQLKMVCLNVEVFCNRGDIQKLYLTGSKMERLDDSLLEKIEEDLTKAGITVVKGSNVNYDDKSLRAMLEQGWVVFVERIGISSLSEIEQEIQRASESGVGILGSVVLA